MSWTDNADQTATKPLRHHTEEERFDAAKDVVNKELPEMMSALDDKMTLLGGTPSDSFVAWSLVIETIPNVALMYVGHMMSNEMSEADRVEALTRYRDGLLAALAAAAQEIKEIDLASVIKDA